MTTGYTGGDDLDFGETIRGFTEGQVVFARYKLQSILGRGGMGVVWLAWDNDLERNVALKFLPELVSRDAGALADLKRETRKCLELTHPNVIRIYDFIQDDSAAAIAMEYINGWTLSELKAQQAAGVFSSDELEPWLFQICQALDYAHQWGKVVHRDIKPANIMLTQEGVIKIADFGIASSISDSLSRLTIQRGTSGTLAYMSPQQVEGEMPTPSDDIYSLGATIYELLTGKPPFTHGDIIGQIKNKPPASINEKRLGMEPPEEVVPADIERSVLRCLEKNSEERFASANGFYSAATGEELDRSVLKDKTGEPGGKNKSASTFSPKQLRVALIFLGALVIMAIGVSAILFKQQPPAEAKKIETPAPPLPPEELTEDMIAQTRAGSSKYLELIVRLAEQGDPLAQRELARCYMVGVGQDKDAKVAVKWYVKAAEQGHAESQFILGDCYLVGRGVSQNEGKALEWWWKASENGYADASLALLAYMGSELWAEGYFTLAGEQEIFESIRENLAIINQLSEETQTDNAKLSLLASQFKPLLSEDGNRQIPDFIASDVQDPNGYFELICGLLNLTSKSEQQALLHFRQAYEQIIRQARAGGVFAQVIILNVNVFSKLPLAKDAQFAFNLIHRADISEMEEWSEKLPKRLHQWREEEVIFYQLLSALYTAYHSHINLEEHGQDLDGFFWLWNVTPVPEWRVARLEEAGSQNFPLIQLGLGVQSGMNESPFYDYAKCLKWLQKCAKSQSEYSSYAQWLLSQIYLDPDQGAYDQVKGLQLLKQASDSGLVSAAYQLGKLYLDGKAVARDLNLAHNYLTQAKAAGDRNAQRLLDDVQIEQALANGSRKYRLSGYAIKSFTGILEMRIGSKRITVQIVPDIYSQATIETWVAERKRLEVFGSLRRHQDKLIITPESQSDIRLVDSQ